MAEAVARTWPRSLLPLARCWKCHVSGLPLLPGLVMHTHTLRNQVLSEQFLPHTLKITSLSNLILTWAHDIVTSKSH